MRISLSGVVIPRARVLCSAALALSIGLTLALAPRAIALRGGTISLRAPTPFAPPLPRVCVHARPGCPGLPASSLYAFTHSARRAEYFAGAPSSDPDQLVDTDGAVARDYADPLTVAAHCGPYTVYAGDRSIAVARGGAWTWLYDSDDLERVACAGRRVVVGLLHVSTETRDVIAIDPETAQTRTLSRDIDDWMADAQAGTVTLVRLDAPWRTVPAG